jgi:hypothetical protein
MTEKQIRTLAENTRRAGQLATNQPSPIREVFAVIHTDLRAKLSAENQKQQR